MSTDIAVTWFQALPASLPQQTLVFVARTLASDTNRCVACGHANPAHAPSASRIPSIRHVLNGMLFVGQGGPAFVWAPRATMVCPAVLTFVLLAAGPIAMLLTNRNTAGGPLFG